MDLKRILLIIGLVVVGYLIMLQWSHDPRHQATNIASSEGRVVNQKQSSATLGDVPVPTATSNNVPVISTEKHATVNSLITVTTDNLELKINPHGGNIVYLALPQYPKKQGQNAPYILLDNSKHLTYIAQSGLVGNKGVGGVDNSGKGLPLYSVAQQHYMLENGQKQLVVDLHLKQQGVDITKRYTFTRGDYAIKLSYLIHNTASSSWSGEFYAQLKRDNSKDPGLAGNHGTSIHSYLGAAVRTNDAKFKKLDFDDFAKKPFSATVTGGYAAILQHYFEAAWVPDQNQSFTYTTREASGDNIIGLQGALVTVKPGETSSINAILYTGPKIKQSLEKLATGLDLTVDYGYLWFIASPMFMVLNFLHKLLGNWGWSIIALTALIKLVFFPLSAASYRSMAKMRALQPRMKALKERYGDDRQKMSQELMGLYKKEKVNPMGGCLPIIVQMPFFIALYEVLMEAVQLRQAPWMFWIHDLSRMDPYFILPIIMGGLMLIQQRLSPAPPDPTQAKIMRLMPIMFTIFFLWFPAGLVIYWVTNNFLSILQQWWITKKCEQQMAAAKALTKKK